MLTLPNETAISLTSPVGLSPGTSASQEQSGDKKLPTQPRSSSPGFGPAGVESGEERAEDKRVPVTEQRIWPNFALPHHENRLKPMIYYKESIIDLQFCSGDDMFSPRKSRRRFLTCERRNYYT